jgi:glycosyltransferase involved in cell wall biosynthesis
MTSPFEGKKILLVNHAIPPLENTGTPITTLNHARGLQERGRQVAILVPSQAEVRVGFKKEIQDGYTLYRVPAFNRYQAFLGSHDKEALKLFLATIARITRDFSPDIVHINDYVGMPMEIIALFHDLGCLLVRTVCNDEEICHQDYPVVSSGLDGELCSGPTSAARCADCYRVHVAGMNGEKIRPDEKDKLAVTLAKRMAALRKLYREKIDGVVFTSVPFKDHFTSFMPIDADKIRIIPRGFKVSQRKEPNLVGKAPGQEVRFAFFGTMMFSKGTDVLFKAFERIAYRKSFHLDLHGNLGHPQFQTWLHRLEKEFPGRISFHGNYRQENFADLAGQTDVAIVPSYFDTYNRVVRECLYNGVPVIATSFFGSFIIRDGINGLMVPIGDDGALAAAMERVIDVPGLVDTLQAGARASVIPSLDDEIAAMLDLYETLLVSRPRNQAKVSQAKSKNRRDFYSGNDTWSPEGNLYLRDIDRLILSILQNSANLPVSFPSTLFVDTGAGFNAQDTVRESITHGDDGSFGVTFDLRGFETILGLRFDPWEGTWGRLRLDEIVVETESGQQRLLPLDRVHAENGALGNDGFFTFKTSDPIIELSAISGRCSTLAIRGNLEFLDVHWMEAEWAEEKKVWEAERRAWAAERDALREQLACHDQENRNLELLLTAAIVVRGWHAVESVSRPVILFGTGSLAEWVLQLIDRKRFPVRCCFDNRPRAALFHDLVVQKPAFIPDVQVIIASIFDSDIRQQLRDLGYKDENLLSLRIEKPGD